MEPLKLITRTESWAKAAQPNVVEVMEDFLRMAQSGEIVGVVIAAETVEGRITTSVLPTPKRALMVGALSHLLYRLNKTIDES